MAHFEVITNNGMRKTFMTDKANYKVGMMNIVSEYPNSKVTFMKGNTTLWTKTTNDLLMDVYS